MKAISESRILELLKDVRVPSAKSHIVEDKALDQVQIRERSILLSLRISALTPMIEKSLRFQIEKVLKAEWADSEVVIEFVSGASEARADRGIQSRVGSMIAVASGKGGVGKSATTVNLAVAFQKLNYRVGILDCDVYGPSVPLMLKVEDQKPLMLNGKIQPVEAYGLKVMSAGFFIEPGQSIVWRGPMLHKLIQQFVNDVAWDGLDVLVVDLPPGTGDAPLSLAQTMPLTGAVMVSTPQAVSLIDVHKGISMFSQVKVPILGVVENMSHFVCPKCSHDEEIFDRGHVRSFCEDLHLSYLGDIPIDPRIRAMSDQGRPFLLDYEDSQAGKAFMSMAKRLQPFLKTADEIGDNEIKLVV